MADAANPIQFELVSPERLLASAPADMVVVPGQEGDMGVLRGHIPVIAALRPGVVRVWRAGTLDERIFVSGGLVEATAERITILADDATPVAELDAGQISAERGRLEAEPASPERERRLAILRAQQAAIAH